MKKVLEATMRRGRGQKEGGTFLFFASSSNASDARAPREKFRERHGIWDAERFARYERKALLAK